MEKSTHHNEEDSGGEIYEEMAAGQETNKAEAAEELIGTKGEIGNVQTAEAGIDQPGIEEGQEDDMGLASGPAGNRMQAKVIHEKEKESCMIPSDRELEPCLPQVEGGEERLEEGLLIGRRLIREHQGLTVDQERTLHIIKRDLSSLEKIIAEPDWRYPIMTNEICCAVGEDLISMERTIRVLSAVPENLREMGEQFPISCRMREYMKHDVQILQQQAVRRADEFSREINKFQRAKERLFSLNARAQGNASVFIG